MEGLAQGEEYRRGTEEGGEVEDDEEGCGPECRNLLHEVGHFSPVGSWFLFSIVCTQTYHINWFPSYSVTYRC